VGLFYVFNKNLSRFEKPFTMALTVNFSASTNITTPSIITLTDTSTGTDGTITERRVYLQKSDGTYLVPTGTTTDYIVWAIASTTTIIDVLDVDYALNITVQWLAGTTVTYTKTTLYEFNTNARVFRIKLLKAQASNPRLVNSANFFQVQSNLTTFIDGADEAVLLAGDITLAQLCNDNAAVYINNPKLAY
jgi:hypothetical protein